MRDAIGRSGSRLIRRLSFDRGPDFLQIVDEATHLDVPRLVRRRAENRRRMYGRRDELRERRRHELAALNRHFEFRADHRLRRGRSEADDGARLDDVDLRLQPRHASGDLDRIRLLVDASLSARLPFEMLHDVRDVDARSIDARFVERLVEQCARRTDERTSGEILFVARLLADEHHRRRLLSFTEHGLRSGFPKIAALAIDGFESKLVDRLPTHEVGENATDDPTHVKSLLKSTPNILPRERRTRFCARIGFGSPSGGGNTIRISTFTPPPSTA